MPACARWRCTELPHDAPRVDTPQQPGLAAYCADRRPGAASAPTAAVGGGPVAGLCTLAGADPAHALALSGVAGAAAGAGTGDHGGISGAGDLDRPRCRGNAAADAVHAQAAGNAQTPRCAGSHLPGILHRCRRFPVRPGPTPGTVSVLLPAGAGCGPGRVATDAGAQRSGARHAHRWAAAVAGGAADGGAVRAVPTHRPAVVGQCAGQPGAHRAGGKHGAGGCRRTGSFR